MEWLSDHMKHLSCHQQHENHPCNGVMNPGAGLTQSRVDFHIYYILHTNIKAVRQTSCSLKQVLLNFLLYFS